MLAYLDWETRLVSRVERGGDLRFLIVARQG